MTRKKNIFDLLKSEFYNESNDIEIYAKSIGYMFAISLGLAGFFQVLLFKKFDISLYFFDINELVNTGIVFFTLLLPFLLVIKKTFSYNLLLNVIIICILSLLLITNKWLFIGCTLIFIGVITYFYYIFQENLEKLNPKIVIIYMIIIGLFIFIPNVKSYYFNNLNIDYSVCLKDSDFILNNIGTNTFDDYKFKCHEVRFFNHKYILTTRDEILNNGDSVYILKTQDLVNKIVSNN